jgi:hypothetical protein
MVTRSDDIEQSSNNFGQCSKMIEDCSHCFRKTKKTPKAQYPPWCSSRPQSAGNRKNLSRLPANLEEEPRKSPYFKKTQRYTKANIDLGSHLELLVAVLRRMFFQRLATGRLPRSNRLNW